MGFGLVGEGLFFEIGALQLTCWVINHFDVLWTSNIYFKIFQIRFYWNTILIIKNIACCNVTIHSDGVVQRRQLAILDSP